MSPVTFKTSEDKKPLIITEDTESPSNSSVEHIKLMAQQPLHIDTSNPFASFDEVFYHGNNNNNNDNNNHNNNNIHKPKNKKSKHYKSVGELLWYNGHMYSDVRLTFEDRGMLATRAGIPSELRLHSLVLSQSQFFKEQLSVTAPSSIPTSTSGMLKEKQIIVRLPSRVTEEDIINFYCTLKLMYTKNWDTELSNNLTKGVGCLSVCCEIGFYEGIEACWKWLVKKCNRDNNKEMMRRLIEAYPSLHEQFTEPEEKIISNSYLDVPIQRSSSKIKRTPPISRRTSRRSRRRTNSNGSGSYARQSLSPVLKSNRSDTSFSSDSSASPLFRYENDLLPPPPPITLPPSLPSPPHSDNSPITPTNSKNDFPSLPSTIPPSIFNNTHILNTWMSRFESYAISSKRACSKMSAGFRDDAKCFPFLEHFVSIFDSINQLGRAKRISSPEALDYTLRMLNVIKIEHTHFHTLHAQKNKSSKSPKSPKSPKSQPSSPRSTSRPSSPLDSNNNSPSIVLHASLDDPLSKIMKNVLAPLEQKHLCDYLWAPSNISNLMHLKEILSDDDDDMEDDEFNSYDQLMSEASLVKASRVSKVEHMIVGEKMAKYMREFRSNNNLSS